MLLHVVVLAVGAAVVWRAGTTLSRDADQLAAATRLGRAFIGVVVLGFATSLPEIATTVTASALGNPRLATGNLLGGVALQMVVLVLADALARDQPLMSLVTRRVTVVQHLALLVLLAVAVAGMLLPEPLAVAGVGFWTGLLVVLFVLSLAVVRRVQPQREESVEDRPARPPTWRFAVAGGAILVAGWAIARSADELSRTGPLDATFLGAVLVALATSLPEISTVVGAARARSYDLAVSNILGTNGIEVALLAVADAGYRQGPLLSQAAPADVLLAVVAAVLTALYLASALVRPRRSVAGLGPSSLAVLAVYLLGLAAVALV